MEADLYINKKPLIQAPPSIHQKLSEQLQRVQLEPREVFGLDVKHQTELIETDGLKSMWADKQPVFQSLLQSIHSWNGTIMDLRLDKIPHINNQLVSHNIYKLLRNNLVEVINTKNKMKQIEYLDKVKIWFYETMTETQKAGLEKSIEANQSQAQKMNDKTYPAEHYESSLHDYWNNYRSIHTDIKPSYDRIKGFQRKNLISAVSTTMTRPGTSSQGQAYSSQFGYMNPDDSQRRPDTSEQYRMIDRVQTAKLPKTSLTQKRGLIKIYLKKAIQSQQGQRQPRGSDWLSNQQFPVFDAFESKSTLLKTIPNLSLTRNQSPLKSEKIFEDSPLQDSPLKHQNTSRLNEDNSKIEIKSQFFNFELKKQSYQGEKLYLDDAKTQRAYDDYSTLKIQNKNAETRSSYLTHDGLQQGEQDQEYQAAMLRMQELYHRNRNTEIRNKREDEELLNTMQEWANNRGRVNEMMTQKTETLIVGSKYGHTGIKMSDLFEDTRRISVREQVVKEKQKERVHEQDGDEEIPEAEFDEEEAYQKYIVTTKPKGYQQQELSKSSSTLIPKRSAKSAYNPQVSNYTDFKPVQMDGAVDFQEQLLGLEQKLKYQKLQQLKQFRGNLVPGGLTSHHDLDPKEVERRKMTSSSSYSQIRPKSQVANRPFSGIYKRFGVKNHVNDTIVEINRLKSALDVKRYKQGEMNGEQMKEPIVSIQTLKKSLIIPMGLIQPHLVLLPSPGAGLSEPPEFPKLLMKKQISKVIKSKK